MLSALISAVLSASVKLILQALEDRRAARAQRDLGAESEANHALTLAEEQERTARAAGNAAINAVDNPRDILPEKAP